MLCFLHYNSDIFTIYNPILLSIPYSTNLLVSVLKHNAQFSIHTSQTGKNSKLPIQNYFVKHDQQLP